METKFSKFDYMSVATETRKRSETNGVVRLSQAELRELFDAQARETLGLSGDAALKRIRKGRAGSNLAWTGLTLLSALFRE